MTLRRCEPADVWDPLLGDGRGAGPLFDSRAVSTSSSRSALLGALAPSGGDPAQAGGPCHSVEQVGSDPDPSPLVARTVFGGKPYRPVSPDACMAGAWSIVFADLATGELGSAPFRCRSWRCRRCAPLVNARDAERISRAIERVEHADLLFVTLTFDQSAAIARAGGDELRARARAWRSARHCFKRLRDALAYRYGVDELDARGRTRRRKAVVRYVQTWEQHASGWPHVHVIVSSREIAADVRRRGSFERVELRSGERKTAWRWESSVLAPLARAAGFGARCGIEFARKGAEAIAGYLVSLARELVGGAVKDQLPVDAPRGFRRLRSSKRFLPKLERRVTRDLLGFVVQRDGDELADPDVLAGAFALARERRDAERRARALAPERLRRCDRSAEHARRTAEALRQEAREWERVRKVCGILLEPYLAAPPPLLSP